MKKEDEEKTAFITPWGCYCYRVMSFGLKNAGATYQRMMQNCLKEQIGKNVQVYVDDIVIKSKKAETCWMISKKQLRHSTPTRES